MARQPPAAVAAPLHELVRADLPLARSAHVDRRLRGQGFGQATLEESLRRLDRYVRRLVVAAIGRTHGLALLCLYCDGTDSCRGDVDDARGDLNVGFAAGEHGVNRESTMTPSAFRFTERGDYRHTHGHVPKSVL